MSVGYFSCVTRPFFWLFGKKKKVLTLFVSRFDAPSRPSRANTGGNSPPAGGRAKTTRIYMSPGGGGGGGGGEIPWKRIDDAVHRRGIRFTSPAATTLKKHRWAPHVAFVCLVATLATFTVLTRGGGDFYFSGGGEGWDSRGANRGGAPPRPVHDLNAVYPRGTAPLLEFQPFFFTLARDPAACILQSLLSKWCTVVMAVNLSRYVEGSVPGGRRRRTF